MILLILAVNKTYSIPINTYRGFRSNLHLYRFTLTFFCGLLLTVLAAAIWQGEEPCRIRTYTLAMGVFLTATAIILLAARWKLIGSASFWLLLFALKLVLNVASTYYLWFEPLAPDLLRVMEGESFVKLQDSNLYDYYALKAAENGILQSWDFLNFTWLSFGITSYLAIIYSLLGVSVAYVSMCNALLSLVGLIMLCATLRLLFEAQRKWDWVALSAFIPSIAYYDATPAKEPLTQALYLSGLYAITALLWKRQIQFNRIMLVLLMLGLLALVRVNVVFMLLIACSYPVLHRVGIWKSLAVGIAVTIMVVFVYITLYDSPQVLSSVFELEGRITSVASLVEERGAEGATGLKQVVSEAFAPRSASHLLLWSPLRPVIWFYLPYPLLIPSFNGLTNVPSLFLEARMAKVFVPHELAFTFSGYLLILATPYLIGACLSFFRGNFFNLSLLLFNIFIPALLIGNLQFIMGRRYRILIEPIVLATVLVAIHYRLGRKLIWPVWLLMFGGVILVALL